MSSSTSDPNKPVQSDREYYADLWGHNPVANQRQALIGLKRRSGYVAAMAALALGLQLVVGALQSAPQPSIEIGPAVGVGQPQRLSQQLNRAQAQDPEPQRRVSGAVGEFGSD